MAEILQTGRNDGVLHWRSTEESRPLDDLLKSLANIQSVSIATTWSSDRLYDLYQLGAIYDHKGRLESWQTLLEISPMGTYFRIHTQPRRYQTQNINWQERVFFENSDFLIVQKPSCLPCHPMVDNTQENLLTSIQKFRGETLYLTHRLDVPTEGLLLLAKNLDFQSYFNLLLKNRQVQKTYVALVAPDADIKWAPGDELVHYMKPSPRAPKELSKNPIEKYQDCRLRILNWKKPGYLEVELLTGRTHQIRAQLSFEGFPLLGDTAYGGKDVGMGPDNITLQAVSLSFPHPSEPKMYEFRSPLSEKLQSLLRSNRQND